MGRSLSSDPHFLNLPDSSRAGLWTLGVRLVTGYAIPYMEGMAQGQGQEPEVTRGLAKGSIKLGFSQGMGSEAQRTGPGQGSQFSAVRLAVGPAFHPSLLSLLPHCCSGLGYVLGSVVAELTGNWRWALRVSSTSFLSLCLTPWAGWDFPVSMAFATWHSTWRHVGCWILATRPHGEYGLWKL